MNEKQESLKLEERPLNEEEEENINAGLGIQRTDCGFGSSESPKSGMFDRWFRSFRNSFRKDKPPSSPSE